MDARAALITLLAALLSGATVSSGFRYIRDRSQDKELHDKLTHEQSVETVLLPLDVESRQIANLQAQVTLQAQVNKTLADDNERLRTDLASTRERLEQKDLRIEELESKLSLVERECADIRHQLRNLKEEHNHNEAR